MCRLVSGVVFLSPAHQNVVSPRKTVCLIFDPSPPASCERWVKDQTDSGWVLVVGVSEKEGLVEGWLSGGFGVCWVVVEGFVAEIP